MERSARDRASPDTSTGWRFSTTISTGSADYAGDAPFVFDEQAREAFAERQAQIKDYYEARDAARTDKKLAVAGAPYNPVPPAQLYEMDGHPYALGEASAVQLSAFALPDEARTEDAGGRLAHNFAAERQAQDVNLFAAVVTLLRNEGRKHRHTVIACWSDGSRDRMAQLLE